MAENIIKNTPAAVGENWISRINAGGQVYDIATHHSITFKDGKGDTTGTTWNGLSDLEIVIPSITDIVQTPIEFTGTVGATGEITWVNGHSAPAEAGNLVFITADCTFEGHACEAGDMAIYDGKNWNIVSGENQVQLAGETDTNNKLTIAVGSVKDVLTVEGKTLALTLDYAELDKHVDLVKGDKVGVDLTSIAVDSTYVKLTKGDDSELTLGADTTLDLATELADGKVTLTNADKLVNHIEWGTFTAGEFPTLNMNSEKTFPVSGGSLTPTSGQTTGDFVDSVSMTEVSFVVADTNDTNKITTVTGITAVTDKGNQFLTGITEVSDVDSANLTIKGSIVPTEGVDAAFVKGLADNLSTVVTSITSGSIDFKSDGSHFVTGLGDTESATGDVISSVTVSAKNDTSVLNEAKVENHVLSFGSTNVTSEVSTVCQYKSFTKGAYEYTAPVATNTSFVTGGFTQVSDSHYAFSKGFETTYTHSNESWKLQQPTINVTKGTYTLNREGMVTTVGANTFAVDQTSGTLPSLTASSFTTTAVSGTVGTALTTTSKSIHTLASNVESITLPGVYTLTSADAAGEDTVLVGAAGKLAESSVATVDLSAYVTDVTISTSTTNVTPQE